MEGDRSLSIGGGLFDVDFGGGGYCRGSEPCKSSLKNVDGALSTGQAGTEIKVVVRRLR